MKNIVDTDKCKKAMEICGELIECRREQLRFAEIELELNRKRVAHVVSLAEIKLEEASFYEEVCKSFLNQNANEVASKSASTCNKKAKKIAWEGIDISIKANEMYEKRKKEGKKDSELINSFTQLLQEISGLQQG